MARRIFFFVCIILAMSGCSRSRKAPVRTPQASDSLYTAQAAMKIYGKEPDRALAIVDSALIVGNVSAFKADFLRAKILAGSLEVAQRDAAIILCEKLLQHDSTQVVDNRTAVNRNNVLDVMLGACRTNGDDDKWLRYAIERAELCQDMGMEIEFLRMEAEIGAAMTRMGRREEGMIKMEKAINALEKGDPSVDRMDALIVARKRRIVMLDHAHRYQDIIPDAQAILRKLDDYEKRPFAYAEDSFRLQDKNARAAYCDFYRAQAHCFLARAYTMIDSPDMAKARDYVRLVEESDYGHTFSGRWTLSQVWKSLGEWDKVLSVDQEAERLLEGDTLNADFATILKDRADAAKAKGHYAQALSYMDRYTGLKLQLSEQRLESEAQDYAARYHAMEQEQKIRQAESESAHKGAVIQVIALILLIITAFAIYSMRQRRAIGQKNRALARMIGELSSAGISLQTETPKPNKKLFEMIDRIIREEKLYTNVNLQRQDIVDRFDISRHALNDLFTAYADGQSFTAYINDIRMQDAIRLMQKEPDTPIGAIAEAVGFTPANFREVFKRQYGMTPTEYRQNI